MLFAYISRSFLQKETSKIIKLKAFKPLPSLIEINRAANGIDYKNKKADVKLLAQEQNYYNKHVTGLKSIDDFNQRTGRMDISGQSVILNLRDEPLNKTIDQYTRPLVDFDIQSQKYISIINDTWRALYDTKHLEKINLDISGSWVYSPTSREYESVFSKTPHIIPYMRKWLSYQNYNFLPLFETLQIYRTYNVTDHSATSSILTKRRNNLATYADEQVKDINDRIKNMEIKNKLAQQLKDGVKLTDLFPEYDFNKLFPDHSLSARSCSSLHQVACEKPEVKAWIKLGAPDDNYAMYEYVSKHPAIQQMGHSGFSWSWTVQTMRYVYSNDWATVVKNIYVD